MRRIILVIIALITAHVNFAQSVTGSWYGRADVMMDGANNNYLTELILKQKGDEVEGVFGYYFKDTYQSFFIRGTYDKKNREVYIKNIPLLYYRSTSRNGIECPMSFIGTLVVSQVKSTLNGYFYSAEDKYKYTCPELRVSMSVDITETNQDSILRNTVAGKKFWKPLEEDVLVSNVDNDKPVTITPATINEIPVVKLNEVMEKKLIQKFEQRQNTYGKDIEIESDSIRISFYDNGDVDGDVISIFLNKTPVMAQQPLTERALNIYLSLDSLKEFNEISMLAENLGKFPPNTALMVVTDGIKRHEVYLSSSLKQNASIRFKRKKVNPHLLR
jgi:hypothetical protein